MGLKFFFFVKFFAAKQLEMDAGKEASKETAGADGTASVKKATQEEATEVKSQPSADDEATEAPESGKAAAVVEICGHKLNLDHHGICTSIVSGVEDQPHRLDFLVGAAFDLGDDQN